MTDAASRPLPLDGLTDEEAARRLAAEGPNELPRPDRRTPLRIVGEVLREPMLALLLGGGLVYLLLGDTAEALVLLAFAQLSIVITVVQESRTERVLEALRDLTSPRAVVIRAGARRRIDGRDVVRGDLLVLAEGERVAADGILRHGHDLQIDESLLTGESVPVAKTVGTEAAEGPDEREAAASAGVFSGTLVVRGGGIA
jgi:Ca2+-transporting ATPase